MPMKKNRQFRKILSLFDIRQMAITRKGINDRFVAIIGNRKEAKNPDSRRKGYAFSRESPIKRKPNPNSAAILLSVI